jgi:hypothetical protein
MEPSACLVNGFVGVAHTPSLTGGVWGCRDRIAEVAAKVLPLEDLPADEGRLPPPGPTADTAHFPKPGEAGGAAQEPCHVPCVHEWVHRDVRACVLQHDGCGGVEGMSRIPHFCRACVSSH